MRGTTLIETVVLVGITTAALLALVNLFVIFNNIYGYQQTFMATAGSSGRALDALGAAILPANAVRASHVFSGTTYSSASTTIVLELPSVDSTGDIVSGAKDYIVFYASSTELYRRVEAHAASVRTSGLTKLSSTLSSLSFTYDHIDFAQVAKVAATIQTAKLFKQQSVQSTLSEEWYLRNASL